MDLQQNDIELWEKLKQKDPLAFETVYTTYRKLLVITAMGILKDEELAKDLVQQFFTNLWNSQPKKKQEDIISIKDYLFVSIRNRCLDVIKSNGALKRTFASTQLPATYEAPVNILETKELNAYLHNAIEDLPAIRSKVFKLGYIYGKTYQQIADMLSISEHTVRNHMALALKDLRMRLKKQIN